MCLCCCLWLHMGYVWGERPPPPTFGALQTPPLHQLSPAAAGLDAETCIQTKKRGGGAQGELEPPVSGRARASRSPLHRGFY